MADNSTLPATGDVIREVQKGTPKTQVVVIDIGGSGTESLLSLDAPAALADNLANPTALIFGACGLIYDGATWDRMPGDAANGVDVDVTRLPALPAGTNHIGEVALDSTALAALESITVGGTVELGSTSLAALETITVGGTIELGSTSLAALESITAVGPLTDTQLRATPVAISIPVVPAMKTDQSAAVTAAWTSATAVDTALSLTVTNYSTVLLTLNPTSAPAFTAGTLNFELSDDGGTTWYLWTGARDAAAVETAFGLATTPVTSKRAWQFDVTGATNFRVRVNPVIAGAGTANLRMQAMSDSTEPVSLVKRHTDLGRTHVTIYVDAIANTASEVLLTHTRGAGFAATSTGTSYTVSTGKTLRITNIVLTYISTATTGHARVRLRVNTAGAAALGSPVAGTWDVGSDTPATANCAGMVDVCPVEGIDVPAGAGIGLTTQGLAAAVGAAAGLIAICVTGYEYTP